MSTARRAQILHRSRKDTFEYTTAYGETVRTGSESFPYAFTGRRFVESAALYDYRTRAYDPRLARFLQRDSIGVWADFMAIGNGYVFVGGDPVGRIDPWGLKPRTDRPRSLDEYRVGPLPRGRSAETGVGIQVEYNRKWKQVAPEIGNSKKCCVRTRATNVKFHAVWDPTQSTVTPFAKARDPGNGDALLRDEQGHFDIFSLCAKRSNSMDGWDRTFATECRPTIEEAKKASREKLDKMMDDIEAYIASWCTMYSEQYDAETRHGADAEEQRRWEEKIQKANSEDQDVFLQGD